MRIAEGLFALAAALAGAAMLGADPPLPVAPGSPAHVARFLSTPGLFGKILTVAQDQRMTPLGDCPAGLKPGRMRRADGKVVAVGDVLAAGGQPSPPKP
ncbi:hypothetical protein [Phenylobacterium sp.]|uniref:hypothetical protein n=1 Tax=Phenylobacterium sp. TaxID=1871053 RepID=UPI00120B84BB|nr:hypothetical protein [Phenylobacterium sp.]THD63636.1 MAG: hypothetical protein E8A49_04565 [Phenylobacterium sp.]